MIIVPPVIDAFTPAQIVAMQSDKNFISCRGGGFGEVGHDSAYECLWLHDTENSDSVCCTEKIFCLVNQISKKGMIFIIWCMLHLCWSKNCYWCPFYCWRIFRQMIVWVMPTIEKLNPLSPLNDLWRMNQHPNYAPHLHQCHILIYNGIEMKKH